MPTFILDILDRTTPQGKVFRTAHLQGRIVRQIEHLDTDGRSQLRVTQTDEAGTASTATHDIIDPEDEHYPDFVPASGVSGTANSIILDPRYPVSGYSEGLTFLFQAKSASTGNVSIRLDSESQSRPLYFGPDRAGSGDVQQGAWYEVVLAGNRFHVLASSMAAVPEHGVPVLDSGGRVPADDVPDINRLNGRLSIAKGGTDATSISAARTALGLGTAARLNSGTTAGRVPVLQSNSRMAPGDVPEIGTIVSETYTRGTGRRYIGVIPLNGAVNEAIILAALNYEVGQQSLTLPTWTGLQRIFIAQPASRDDLTYISLSGIGNSVSAFTKQSPIDVSGTSYDVWLSNEGQEGSSISGLDIQVLPAGVLPLNRGGTGAGYAAMARMGIGAGTSATINTGTASGEIPLIGSDGVAASALPNLLEDLGGIAKPSSAGTYLPTINSSGTVTLAPYQKHQTIVALIHAGVGQLNSVVANLIRPQSTYPVVRQARRNRFLIPPSPVNFFQSNELVKLVVMESIPNYDASSNNAPPGLYNFWLTAGGSSTINRDGSFNRVQVDGVWYHATWSNDFRLTNNLFNGLRSGARFS